MQQRPDPCFCLFVSWRSVWYENKALFKAPIKLLAKTVKKKFLKVMQCKSSIKSIVWNKYTVRNLFYLLEILIYKSISPPFLIKQI